MRNIGLSGKFYSVVILLITALIGSILVGLNSLHKFRASTDDTIDRVMMVRVSSNRTLQRVYTYNDILKEMLLNTDEERERSLAKEFATYQEKVQETLTELVGYTQGDSKLAAEAAKTNFSKLEALYAPILELAKANKGEEGYHLYLSTALPT